MSRRRIIKILVVAECLIINPIDSQTISTNMPLPPMEWIKLSPSGTSTPPGLSHGCLMGPTYSESTSSLPGFNQAYLFGGRSAAGTTSNGLYILDYSKDPPVWSQPLPTTSTIFTTTPQPRSHLLCGWDSASNFRNQLNIYAGRSEDGSPLSDFWYYDPTNRFWAQPKDFQPTNHPPNYGSIGGIDPTYLPAPPGTSNSLIYIGGANSTHSNTQLAPIALSFDGQLGSNTNTINVNLSDLSSGLRTNNNLLIGRWGTTGTIMSRSKMVIFSGCSNDPANEFKDPVDPSCALTNGGILSFESSFTASQLSTRPSIPSSSWAGFNYCPAPRIGGTMVPNRNGYDGSYSNQVIMIGGRIDHHNWDDQGGSQAGEVAVLDTSSGVWARTIPMIRNNAIFTPKEGLLALALPSKIGSSSTTSSGPTDILVYGGIDVNSGQASNELWILRLHPAKLTGNGTAGGITMNYMSSCATPTPQNKKQDPTKSTNDGTPGESAGSGPLQAPIAHLIFSGIALAIMMASLTILRCEEPGKLSIRSRWRTSRLWLLIGAWHALITSCGLLALAILVALFNTRLTTTPTTLSLSRRGLLTGSNSYDKLHPHDTLNRSAHARLGLAITIVGFLLVPALYLLSWLDESLESKRKKKQLQQSSSDAQPRKLKAKDSQGIGSTRRALQRMALLTRQPFRQSSREEEKQQESGRLKEAPALNRPQVEESSVEKKGGEFIVERRDSVNSTSPKRPPLAISGSHECTDSSSTSHTSTQLLSQATTPGSSAQNPQSTPALLAPESSASQLKPDPKPVERSFVRSLHVPFTKVFNLIRSSEPQNTPTTVSPPPISTGFEVMNRRPPGRLRAQTQTRTRVSLDIMSDVDPNSERQSMEDPVPRRRSTITTGFDDPNNGTRALPAPTTHYPGSAEDGYYEDEVLNHHEEEEEEEEDDDDDSVYKKRVKARRKLRRLADVCLHLTILITNIYFISSCFISQQSSDDHHHHQFISRLIGGIAIGFVGISYAIMVWLAWNRKPSSQSTLVIFISIIKDGSISLLANETLAGIGQFSTFQEQQVAQQQQQQQNMPQTQGQQQIGSGSVLAGGVGKRSVQGLSFYGGSQMGGSALGHGGGMGSMGGGGRFFGGYSIDQHNLRPSSPSHLDPSDLDPSPLPHPSTSPLYDSHRLWAVPPDQEDFFRSDVNDLLNHDHHPNDNIAHRESWLDQREVQIVTTAPKRVLAVVNR
ncbi:hypothetical protein MJO29_015854 [Puccinia striiformis f. sp. tritici]|nr:hypothetical protein MJO29_015854 [Puccinia striiformis f. sp. tritici]